MLTNFSFLQWPLFCPLSPAAASLLLSNDSALLSEYTLCSSVCSCSGSVLHLECYCLLFISKICPSLRCDSSNTFSMKFYDKKKLKFPGYSSQRLPDIYSAIPCLSLACPCRHTPPWWSFLSIASLPTPRSLMWPEETHRGMPTSLTFWPFMTMDFQ